MRTEEPRAVLLKDYAPPAYLIDTVSLEVELDPAATRVHSKLKMRTNPASGGGPLVLDGEKLTLHEVPLERRDAEPQRLSDWMAAT